MPNVLNEFVGDGVTRTFNFSMTGGYLSRDYVFFYTRPNEDLLAYTPYNDDDVTWISDYTVRTAAPIPVGTTFVILRSTTLDPLVDFQNTSRITEKNLDTATWQSIHIAAETSDVVSRVREVAAASKLESADARLSAQASASYAQIASSAAVAASQSAAAAQASAVQAGANADAAALSAQAASDTATAAEGTANAASADAAIAIATANSAVSTANAAVGTANSASAAAGTAVATANSATTTAGAAAADASAAVAAATTAVSTANTAAGAANTAVSVANEAKSLVDNVVAGGVISFNGRTGAVTPQSGDYTKAQVGLGAVDNTSDAAKPLSTAAVSALGAKADKSYVDTQLSSNAAADRSRANHTGYQPISTVAGLQTALDAKSDTAWFESSGVLAKTADFSPVPAWSNPVLNAQAQALTNRTELLRDNQKRTPLVYATGVEAQAAATTLPDAQRVEIEMDETRGSRRTRYVVQSGALAFVGYEDKLRFDLAAAGGSTLVGYDGGTVQDVLNNAKPLQSYTAMLSYSGSATGVRITTPGIAGYFRYNTAAPNTTDGGTRFAHASGVGAWERVYSGFISVGWFGAKGDDATDDTTAIRNAVTSDAGVVFFPDGVYVTSGPIHIDSGVSLYGASKSTVRIKKTSAGIGSGSNLALDGTTDSYAQNAVVILRHPDNSYNYGTTIRGITLESQFTSEYGVYAPRASGLFIENVSVIGCRVGFETHDAWMCSFTRFEIDGVTQRNLDGNNYGWATTSYGIRFTTKTGVHPTGTSCTFNSCWAHDCHVGWDIHFLEYSTLNSCGADNISSGSYVIENSGLTLNSCATENVQLDKLSALTIIGGNVALNSFRTYRIRGGTSGTTAAFFADGCKVTLNACRFEDFLSVGTSFNLVIQNGAKVINNGSGLPGNGNGYISYGGGSVITMFGGSNPHVITSAGVKFFSLVS